MGERKVITEENESITSKLKDMTRKHDELELELVQLNSGLNQSLNQITKLEFDHKAELERGEVKLRLLEETLNKRNEK